MRELERDDLPSPLSVPLILVGGGRVGGSLAAAAERAGIDSILCPHDDAVEFARGAAVLLCVPDDAIASMAARLAPQGPTLIGHASGATTLDALGPVAEAGAGAFSLHPLQTFADGETPVAGTPAA